MTCSAVGSTYVTQVAGWLGWLSSGSARQLAGRSSGRAPASWTLLLPGVARVGLGLRAAAAAELEHVPVEHVVVGEALPVEQVPEQLPQVAAEEGDRLFSRLFIGPTCSPASPRTGGSGSSSGRWRTRTEPPGGGGARCA